MDENERDPVWGPMSHPIRETIEDGRPRWRDHIWFGFWDPLTPVAGELHWNTSPNSPTGKAQFTVAVQGRH